jgi:hypothetical protein
MSDDQLKTFNNQMIQITNINELEFALNRALYNAGPGAQLLPKPLGGKKHRKYKTKKNKSIRHKSRKHRK